MRLDVACAEKSRVGNADGNPAYFRYDRQE